jgi:nucleotide-binding universal stress UspA family protein
MKIEKILIATDFSDNGQRAFERAYDLATQLGAKLYIVHVHDESTLRIAIKEGLLHADSTDEELGAAVEKLTEERFQKMMAGLDLSQINVEHTTRRGDPKVVIDEYAREMSADMLVVGRRGVSVKNIVVGSVADSLIRNSCCPVLVVRRDHCG